jgi:hypothetical protein
VLIKNRALFVTGLTLLLFHLANAALLPMLSMRVAAAPASINPGLYAAGTVIISQAVMIPVAIWVAPNRTLRLLALNYAGAAGDAGARRWRRPRTRR